MKRLGVCILTVVLSVGCDSKSGEVDLEEQQWQVLYLQSFQSDVSGSCLSWQNEMLACFEERFRGNPDLVNVQSGVEAQHGIALQLSSLYVRGVKEDTAPEKTFLALMSVANGVAVNEVTGMVESFYGVTVPSPVGQESKCSSSPLECPYTTAEICQVLPDAEAFTGSEAGVYSDGAKECTFLCNQDYWKRRRSEGNCPSGFMTILAEQASDRAFSDCIEECFVRGSLLPPY